MFQDDIFPDCASPEPALTSAQWIDGETADPKTMSLAPGFVQKKVASADFNPTVQEEAKPLSEKEVLTSFMSPLYTKHCVQLKEEVDKLTKRVAYLEAELIKRDAKIKELSNQ